MLSKASSGVWGWEGGAYMFYQSLLHLFGTEEEVQGTAVGPLSGAVRSSTHLDTWQTQWPLVIH